MITALASDQMIAPSYWVDPKSGLDYMLTVQYPENRVHSILDLKSIPLRSSGQRDSTRLDNISKIARIESPTEVDHYQLRRTIDIYVRPECEDWRRIADGIDKITSEMKIQDGVPCTPAPSADDIARYDYRIDSDGAEAWRGQRSLCATGACNYRRPDGFGGADRVCGSRGLLDGVSQAAAQSRPRGGKPVKRTLCLISTVALLACAHEAPMPLTLPDAEAIAIKHHPQLAAARLYAQAADQVTNETRSAYYPNLFASVTGASAGDNSRIAAGGLSNSIIYDRLATGVTVGQTL